ncbi:glycosyltransferase family 4 protein [Nonomuraea sp. NPDC004354]
MRVAFVLGTTSGGTGRHVRMLAEGLLRRGHRVVVIGPPSVEEQFGFRAAGAGFAPVPVADRPHPVNDATAVLRIRRHLRGADVAHAHGLRAGALAALAGPRAPLVVTLHNALTAGGLVGAVYGVLERIVARRADKVIVVSPDLGDRMRALGARDVVPAVVPAPPLRPATRPEPAVREELGAGERPLVLTVARLAQQKGLETLLDLAASFSTSSPDASDGTSPDVGGGASAGVAGETSPDVRTGTSAGVTGGTNADLRGGTGPDVHSGTSPHAPSGTGAGVAGGTSPDVHSGTSPHVHNGASHGARGVTSGSGVRDGASSRETSSRETGGPLFAVAGEGPLRQALQARIDAEKLPVLLLGNRDDIPDLLAAATLVLWPSHWEGQPLSLSEALMAGKPVVATAVGGIPDLVDGAGRLVPYGDLAAMREAVRELIDDPGARERLAVAAARRGAALPGADEAVEAALAAYRQTSQR